MKEIPSPENQEDKEKLLIEALKEKGREDSRARELLNSWIRDQEAQVEASNDPVTSIEFNLKKGRLYCAAGCVEEGLDMFDAALTQAWDEKMDEFYAVIEAEMKKMKRNELKEQQ